MIEFFSFFDFVPCCCVSGQYTDGDGHLSETVSAAKPGMLDLVTGRFFINKGTATDFTTGSYVSVE